MLFEIFCNLNRSGGAISGGSNGLTQSARADIASYKKSIDGGGMIGGGGGMDIAFGIKKIRIGVGGEVFEESSSRALADEDEEVVELVQKLSSWFGARAKFDIGDIGDLLL